MGSEAVYLLLKGLRQGENFFRRAFFPQELLDFRREGVDCFQTKGEGHSPEAVSPIPCVFRHSLFQGGRYPPAVLSVLVGELAQETEKEGHIPPYRPETLPGIEAGKVFQPRGEGIPGRNR